MREHGLLEDIGAEIGFTATNALVDWFGGANLHIPVEATEDHPIAKVIGMPAFKRLVKMFGGNGTERVIWIPWDYQREMDRRERLIAVLYEFGMGTKKIAWLTGMSERHVQHSRYRLEEMGLLPMILKRAGIAVEKPIENPAGKAGPKTAGKSHAKRRAKRRG
jgi:hypothetical protein